MAEQKIPYIVSYGGGRGPDVWDSEEVVHASNIREALDIAEPEVKRAGGVIFAIQEEGC